MSDSNTHGQWQTIFNAGVSGNARFRFGVRDEVLAQLFSSFKTSQGYLYHYTKLNVAESIAKGEVWLTRADDFLDQTEIDHGLSMLISAVPGNWENDLADRYRHLLVALREVLTKCYVFSLSVDPANAYLRKIYSGENGAILRLPSNLSYALASGWHTMPTESGYAPRYANDLYELIQGFVIYDLMNQERISSVACNVFRVIASRGEGTSPESIVEFLHFRDALLQCLILFKEPNYIEEQEYRMALVLKPGSESFDHVREIKNRQSRYIKLRLALPYIEHGTEILRAP